MTNNLTSISGGLSDNLGTGSNQGNTTSANTATVLQSNEVIDKLLASGVWLAQDGNLDEALVVFNEVLQTDPNCLSAMNNIAIVYAQKKDYLEAIKMIDKVIAIKPKIATSYLNKGNFLFNLKRYEEALIVYSQALEHDFLLIPAIQNKAIVLHKLGKIEEAARVATEAEKWEYMVKTYGKPTLYGWGYAFSSDKIT